MLDTASRRRHKIKKGSKGAGCSVANLDLPACAVILRKGELAVVFGEPDTLRFLAAVQRLKRQTQKRERQTRLAKQRCRAVLRKLRAG